MVLRRAWYGPNGTHDATATGVHDVTFYLGVVLAHLAADGCREANRLEGALQGRHVLSGRQLAGEPRRRSTALWGEARAVCEEGLAARLSSLPVQFGDWDQEMARITALRALLQPPEAERRWFADRAEGLNKEHHPKTQAIVHFARGLSRPGEMMLAVQNDPLEMPCGIGLGYLAFGPPVYSSRPLR